MNRPTCATCGAYLQAVRLGGVEHPRCPWAKLGKVGDCDWPYRKRMPPDAVRLPQWRDAA